MQAKKQLKDIKPGVYLDNGYCAETQRRISRLRPIFAALKKIDARCSMMGDRILYKGRMFSEKNICDLPLDPHNIATQSEGSVTVFSGRHSRLSNLYKVNFELDGRIWNSVEQYYQCKKAEFDDNTPAKIAILASVDPEEAMLIGRDVRPGPEWENTGPKVMKKAMVEKFKIPAMKLALKSTKEVIGEATKNSFWGIGLNQWNSDSLNTNSWTGKNTAGKCLMEIRGSL